MTFTIAVGRIIHVNSNVDQYPCLASIITSEVQSNDESGEWFWISVFSPFGAKEDKAKSSFVKVNQYNRSWHSPTDCTRRGRIVSDHEHDHEQVNAAT